MGDREGIILKIPFGLSLERLAEKGEEGIPCRGNSTCQGRAQQIISKLMCH